LIKGSRGDQFTPANCGSGIQELCAQAGPGDGISLRLPVSRLSALPAVFQKRAVSYPTATFARGELLSEKATNIRSSRATTKEIGKPEVDQERIHRFFSSGAEGEIDSFVDQLLRSARDERSLLTMFCRYLTMTVYFAAAAYLDSIGCHAESYWPPELRPKDNISTPEEARGYMRQIMLHAIHLRDRESRKQQRDLLSKAIAFIDDIMRTRRFRWIASRKR
jgi:hypothetical protein